MSTYQELIMSSYQSYEDVIKDIANVLQEEHTKFELGGKEVHQITEVSNWCYFMKAYHESYVYPKKRHNMDELIQNQYVEKNKKNTRYKLTQKGEDLVNKVKEQYPNAWYYINRLY